MLRHRSQKHGSWKFPRQDREGMEGAFLTTSESLRGQGLPYSPLPLASGQSWPQEALYEHLLPFFNKIEPLRLVVERDRLLGS